MRKLLAAILMLASQAAPAGSLPSVAVSSSDITLRASASRKNCTAPCAVFFSAVASTATSARDSYRDVGYTWTFGDSAGSPVSGTTWANGALPGMSSRNTAIGPIAAHVFENPGNFKVTLTGRNATGTETDTSLTIAVADPDTTYSGANTICVGNSTPTSGAGGCPSSAEVHTTSSWDAVRRYITTNKRILLKRGDTFTATGPNSDGTGINVQGPWQVGAYGSGANPIIRAAANNVILLPEVSSSGPSSPSNWVFMDLQLEAHGHSPVYGVHEMGGGHMVDNVLYLRITGVDTLYEGFHTYDQTNVFVVDCDIEANGRGGEGYGSYSHGLTDSAWLGNYTKVDPVTGDNEHNFRSTFSHRLVLSDNTFEDAQSGGLLIKLHAHDNSGPPNDSLDSRYINIVHNKFSTTEASTDSSWPVAIGPESPTDSCCDDEHVYEVIIDSNLWYGEKMYIYLFLWAHDVVARNNIVNMSLVNTEDDNRGMVTEIRSHYGVGGSPVTPSNIEFYNNTFYSSHANVDGLTMNAITVWNMTGTKVKNNVAVFPNQKSKSMLEDHGTSTDASGNSLQDHPGFASGSPSAPADFRPDKGSPLIGTGTDVPVWLDFFGAPRTASAYDQGAVNH